MISTGGTNAGFYLIKKSIESFSKLKNRDEYDLVISSSPYLTIPEFTFINYRNIGFVRNIHEYIFAADLIISLAGKSTIDESRVYGTPGIFIPIKNHFEQEHRAKTLGYSYDDIFRLETIIEEKLSTLNNNFHTKINDNGSIKAANLIYKILNN